MSDPRPIMRRVSAAQEAPGVTCSASRHAQQIAERLMLRVDMADDRTPHAGESVASVVAALWEARASIARLEAERDAAVAELDYIASNARCDPKMDGQHVWWPTSFNHRLTGPSLRAAIRAAMEKP